jgi:hypothetical protein
MKIEIIEEPIRFHLHGIGGVVENDERERRRLEKAEKMFRTALDSVPEIDRYGQRFLLEFDLAAEGKPGAPRCSLEVSCSAPGHAAMGLLWVCAARERDEGPRVASMGRGFGRNGRRSITSAHGSGEQGSCCFIRGNGNYEKVASSKGLFARCDAGGDHRTIIGP